MRSPRWILAFALVFLGCDEDPPGMDAAPETDSGWDAGLADAGPPPTDEPNKGPWTLRVDTESAVVRWETVIEAATTAVDFEPAAGGMTTTVMGTSTASDVTTAYGEGTRIVEAPDFAGTFYLNEVRLEGLSPATCYTFRIVGWDTYGGRVCTTHEATDHTTPIQFLAIADTNPALGFTADLLTHVLATPPEFVVHVGDMQYYSSIIETWQLWFQLMDPLLEAGPIYATPGNHETEIDNEYRDYFERFWGSPGQDGETIRYHYETGGVHFFAVATQTDIPVDRAEQVAWLDTRLTEVEAEAGYRFSIVYFHHPVYTLAVHSPSMSLRALIEPVLIAHGVPLVLQGHNHVYERFVVGDVTYITVGGGGSGLYELDTNVPDHPDDVPLRVTAERVHHAVNVEIVDRQIVGEVIRIDGTTLETFTIDVP